MGPFRTGASPAAAPFEDLPLYSEKMRVDGDFTPAQMPKCHRGAPRVSGAVCRVSGARFGAGAHTIPIYSCFIPGVVTAPGELI